MSSGFRLLVVNPNTSVAVTESFVTEARHYAPPGTTIDGVTGTFGASIVSTHAENTVAGYSMLELLAVYSADYDAVILAISFDSALTAAREVLSIPVVGITQSTLLEAATFGSKIGLVTFGSVSSPLYDELLTRYDFHDRVAAIEVVEVTTASGYLNDAGRDDAVTDAVLRLAKRGDVAAVAICGAAVVGIASRLQPRAPLPLFDGAASSVKAVLRLISEGNKKQREGHPLAGTVGLSPALAKLISGAGR